MKLKLEKVSTAEMILITPFLVLVVGVALLGQFCGFIYHKIKSNKTEEDFACDWKENRFKEKCKTECDWCKHWNNYKLDYNG